MCRFLMVKSKIPLRIEGIMEEFAEACKKSKTPDGDWQGDGWGISYLDKKNQWVLIKSLNPIWEEKDIFQTIPESRFFLIHARSSSFQNQKNKIEYNQPFISGYYSFVFNGFIKGISLPLEIKGEIGSQKIWNLLLEFLDKNSPEEALILLKGRILKNSKIVNALNIGLCDMENLYAICYYNCNPEYYSLHFFESTSLSILSSEPFSGFNFEKIRSGEAISF